MEHSIERSSAFPRHHGIVAIQKGAFETPSTTVRQLIYYIYIYIYMYINILWEIRRFFFIMGNLRWLWILSRVFANGPGDQSSIPGRVIPKTQKMVLDAALLNTQHYKVGINGKMEQSREWSCAFSYISVL